MQTGKRWLILAPIIALGLLIAAGPGSEHPPPPDHDEAAALLDRLHEFASAADGHAYFALYTPDAVFLGTDPGERWTLDEFRAYADPYFSQGKGWTYHPVERHISFAPGDEFAWFDETLDNAKYGRCRGTGTLRKIDGQWRIVQYSLSVPIPNDLLPKVAEQIRASR